MVKLKPGRRGLMRNGEVTGKLQERGHSKSGDPYIFQFTDGNNTWREEGTCSVGSDHYLDIIALIPKGWCLWPNPEGSFVPYASKVMLSNGDKVAYGPWNEPRETSVIVAYKPAKKATNFTGANLLALKDAWEDKRVTVKAGDYSYEGTVDTVFSKIKGAVRCVVEDENGRLFVHNLGQLEKK